MTKVTCAFAEARISKENSVFTFMWIQVFVNSGVALGQAETPHAGEAVRRHEQRGGFQWLTPHAADPSTILRESCLIHNRVHGEVMEEPVL